jgi:hypothetical protein
MRQSRRGAVATVICTWLLGGAALAAATVVRDARDVKGPIDIKSVSASPAGKGTWKFVISFYGNVPTNGDQGNEYLELWNTRPHRLQGAPPGAFREMVYSVQMPQTGRRRVVTGGHDAPVVTHGYAKVTRHGDTFTILLALKTIGSPKHSFYWKVSSQYYGPQSVCGSAVPDKCSDLAPNGAKVVEEAL